MAELHSSMALNMPRLFEKMNESMIDSMQNAGEPAKTNRPDGLYETNSKLRERGAKDRFVLEDSIYQTAKIHPFVSTGILLGGILLAGFLGSRKGDSDAAERRSFTPETERMRENTSFKRNE